MIVNSSNIMKKMIDMILIMSLYDIDYVNLVIWKFSDRKKLDLRDNQLRSNDLDHCSDRVNTMKFWSPHDLQSLDYEKAWIRVS